MKNMKKLLQKVDSIFQTFEDKLEDFAKKIF